MLYIIVLSLNCLTAEEGATVAKQHLITNAAGFIQSIYFENELTSKFMSEDLFFGKVFLFFCCGFIPG